MVFTRITVYVGWQLNPGRRQMQSVNVAPLSLGGHRKWDCCVFIQLPVCLGTRGLSPPSPCVSSFEFSSASTAFVSYPAVWVAVTFPQTRGPENTGAVTVVNKVCCWIHHSVPKESSRDERWKMLYRGVFWAVNKKNEMFNYVTFRGFSLFLSKY